VKDAIKRDENNACASHAEREQARPQVRDKKKREVIPSDIPSELNAGQQAVLECVKANPGVKVPGIEAETGIPAKSVERHVKVLVERGLIEHRGSKKTGGYHALDSIFGRLLP